ncbi:FAD:protein FMN transferase [Paraflavitalea sp. CAU 1676]|uniref:FAD:protein FMN transferase n=1 Tax=Paraflavitalea sp. CAU 1676 TaxID=3032598 RepID=UPI0023DBECCF|nr:FAD:protein FMN transferase [Paraflavitalea sp. CAU 1676]MDF2190619.1 FAD:protein FMN transferase [Paraflavitalea sp. CAU 1676]
MRLPLRASLLMVCTLLSLAGTAQVARTRMVVLMGARFDFTIVAADSLSAERYIDTCIAEVSRIEFLISDWKPASQVSQVNQQAGIAPVKVDREVLELTERAIRISEQTGGAFDISFAAMEKIWKYDGSMTQMPTEEAVMKAVSKVGYRNIVVDRERSTIFLKLPGMKIGFGALGEGYATDRCRDMMISRGIKAGIVNGSGDMSTWGRQPDGSHWTVGISDPFERGDLYAVLPLRTSAVVTSGSYEKYIELNGKRYSHIINPATGYPATGLMSVTVFGPSAELANAFSTSIMVMGKEAGFKLLRQYPDYRCIMVSDDKKFYTSRGVHLKRYRVKT